MQVLSKEAANIKLIVFGFTREFPLNKYQIKDKRACIILAIGSIQEKYSNP